MLFQSVEGSNLSSQNSSRPSYGSGIKNSCDRQLLANAVRNITVGLLIAVLKVILVLGDAEDPNKGSSGSAGAKIYNVDDEDDDDDYALMFKGKKDNCMDKAKLSDFAKHTLKQICNQEWVHNRCLQVSLFIFRRAKDTNAVFVQLEHKHNEKGRRAGQILKSCLHRK